MSDEKLTHGTLIIPLRWLGDGPPWPNMALDLPDSMELCDHRGTLRYIVESCQCGEELCVTKHPAEKV